MIALFRPAASRLTSSRLTSSRLRRFPLPAALLAAAALALAAPPAGAVDMRYQSAMMNARAFLARGETDAAIKMYQQVLKEHPNDVPASTGYAEALIAAHRLDDAETFLGEALTRIPEKGDLYRALVALRRAQDRPADAFGEVFHVIEANADRAPWAFRETQDLLANGLASGTARKTAEGAARAHPDSDPMAIVAAEVDVFDGRPAGGLERMKRFDADHERRGKAVMDYAGVLQTLGRPDDALAAMQAVAAMVDDPVIRSQVLFSVADLQEKEERYRDALATLQRIRDERRGTSAEGKALLMSADLYQKHLDDPAGALTVYEKLERDPVVGHRRPELLLQMGECYVRLGRFPEAARTYAETVPEAIDPEDAERAAFEQGEVQFFSGAFDSAMALYQDMAQNHPRSLLADDAAARYILLNKFQALGGGEAVKVLGRMEWGRTVGDSAAVDSCAHVLIEKWGSGELGAEAYMALADEAVRGGHFAAALGFLEKVSGDYQDDDRASTALKRQGDLLLEKLNRPQDALLRYEAILTDHPNSVEAGEARRLVERLRRDAKS